MDTDSRKRQLVTYDQLNSLLEFMKENPDLAKGATRGRRGKLLTLKKWNLCAKKLNACQGATKSARGWSKYWCDWKYRVRRRMLELRSAKENNRPVPESLTISEMEEVLLSIIGDSAMDNVVIKTDPGTDITHDSDINEKESLEDNTEECSISASLNDIPSVDKGKRRKRNDRNVFPARKPKYSKQEENESDTDTELEMKCLEIEKERLEITKKSQENLQTIASQITRVADVLSQIRDAMISKEC